MTAREVYREAFGDLCPTARLACGGAWPIAEFLASREKGARVVFDAVEFGEALLLEDHVNDVVILRNGAQTLGVAERETLPAWFVESLDAEGGVQGWLAVVSERHAAQGEQHTARLEHVVDGRQVPCDGTAASRPLEQPHASAEGAKRRRTADDRDAGATERAGADCDAGADRDAGASRAAGADDAGAACAPSDLCRLAADAAAISACDSLYVVELQRSELWRRKWSSSAAGGWTRSLKTRSIRDAFGALALQTCDWNDVDDGVFVGGHGAGKGLHVDALKRTNVGVNWKGYKLVAIWREGHDSDDMVEDLQDVVFASPLTPAMLAALQRAHRVALIRPGDVFLLSGSGAHTTLCVGNGFNVASYEGVVPLTKRLVDVCLRSPLLREDAELAALMVKSFRQGADAAAVAQTTTFPAAFDHERAQAILQSLQGRRALDWPACRSGHDGGGTDPPL
ncbi:hypothetical protein M885DRAFT_621955 [Pelagophyceae sp. CCMP2097]|nr:hypothetical protein M885DRAFT_621955 [Pelagophyceae sp. CCMP2097]